MAVRPIFSHLPGNYFTKFDDGPVYYVALKLVKWLPDTRLLSYDGEPMPEGNPEAMDFRVASVSREWNIPTKERKA